MEPTTILIILLIIILIIQTISNLLKPKRKEESEKKPNYQYSSKQYLLTPNENNFYKSLLPIATQKGFIICPKVRLADLLEPRKGQNWMAAFSRIKSKHVDFLLCKGPLIPILAIELDDKSHEKDDRKERDAFVDQAYKSANFPILHVKGPEKLSEKIEQMIKK